MLDRSDLIDRALFAVLVVDGFIVGVLSVFLTYTRIVDVPVPIGIAIALIGTTVLTWLASRLVDGPAKWLPLLAWFLVVIIGGFSGPGGDILLITDWRAIGLLLGGVVGPVVMSLRGALAGN